MANPEHLAILKQGVHAWNAWRKEAPSVIPDLTSIDLERVNLGGAILTDARLVGANLNFANLKAAKLNGARMAGALLGSTILSDTNFFSANLADAQIIDSDLRNADLRNAKLYGSYLYDSDLRRANLTHTHFVNTRLRGADFSNALLGMSLFCHIDLRGAKGLDCVEHRGPSTIGIDTVVASDGRIPDVFLRGCGVPELFVAYVRSLVNQPLEFHSCFISYSTKDQEFAVRLHADFQSNGVRCWLATEDLKIGDPFRQRIDESIRLHDKLLLILSESSVNSPWVQDEVEAALERERRENRLVLFPIRIDNAVMDTDKDGPHQYGVHGISGTSPTGKTTTATSRRFRGC